MQRNQLERRIEDTVSVDISRQINCKECLFYGTCHEEDDECSYFAPLDEEEDVLVYEDDLKMREKVYGEIVAEYED